jgi:hypothetical protein
MRTNRLHCTGDRNSPSRIDREDVGVLCIPLRFSVSSGEGNAKLRGGLRVHVDVRISAFGRVAAASFVGCFFEKLEAFVGSHGDFRTKSDAVRNLHRRDDMLI